MPMTSHQRDLKRRQRRVRRLRALKDLLQEAQDPKARKRLLEKIRRLSPFEALPQK